MSARSQLKRMVRDNDREACQLSRDVEAAGTQPGAYAVIIAGDAVDLLGAKPLGYRDTGRSRLYAVNIEAAQRVLLRELAAASARRLEAAPRMALTGLAAQLERGSVELAQRLRVPPPGGSFHIIPIAGGSATVGTLQRPG